MLAVLLAFMNGLTTAGETQAAPDRSFLIGHLLDGVLLLPYLEVLEDPSQRLSVDEVSHEPWSSRFQTAVWPVRGVSPSAWWVRFGVDNAADRTVAWLLELLHPHFNHIDLYWTAPDGQPRVTRSGNLQPFSERPVKVERFVFPLETGPHSKSELFFRIAYDKSGLVDFTMAAWDPESYRVHGNRIAILQGGLLGASLVALLFYFSIYFSIRLPVFIWYLSYWASITLLFATYSGLGKQYLWPDSPMLSDGGFFIFGSFTVFFAIQFSRKFLETKRILPWSDRFLVGLHGLNGLGFLAYLAGDRGLAIHITAGIGLGLSLLPLIGVRAWMRGRHEARFFVLAWGVWSAAMVTGILRTFGMIPSTELTIWGVRNGFILESVLLSLALVDQVAMLRRQKLDAEYQSRRILEQANADLEKKVAERTVELEKARRTAEALAQTDGLTGIANRRHFDAVLANEWKRALRSLQPLAVAMIDIDYFKKYNDHYGHQAGDECLRNVSQILKTQSRRAGDLIARYGGEEFVIIAPETNFPNMMALAENIRSTLEALALPHEASSFGQVTASIGVAVGIPKGHETPGRLLQAADQSLYQAKARGRNRVVGEPPPLEPKLGAFFQLVWNAEYACGEPLLDAEHQALFLIANLCIRTILEKSPHDAIVTTLQSLIDTTQSHFQTEEKVLAQYGYLDLPIHRKIHESLLFKGTQLAAHFEAGTTHGRQIIDFIAYDLVSSHILSSDREFFPLFNAC